MCGIAGYVGTAQVPGERIDACLAAMRRRGPDSAGAAEFAPPDGGTVHLLATRLQIIDLDPRSDQPFRVGSKTLVFNGELYNYVELRLALERDGEAFDTGSDTEVMLRAIARRG